MEVGGLGGSHGMQEALLHKFLLFPAAVVFFVLFFLGGFFFLVLFSRDLRIGAHVPKRYI